MDPGLLTIQASVNQLCELTVVATLPSAISLRMIDHHTSFASVALKVLKSSGIIFNNCTLIVSFESVDTHTRAISSILADVQALI